MRLTTLVTVLAILGRAAGAQEAERTLSLSKLFGEGMVIQRGVRVPVWGWGAAGAAITVRLGQQSRRTTADGNGRWSVSFPPMAAGGPLSLTVEADGRRLTIDNVLVGDVWLA